MSDIKAQKATVASENFPAANVYIRQLHHVMQAEQSKGRRLPSLFPGGRSLPTAPLQLSVNPDTSTMYVTMRVMSINLE